MRSAGRAEVIIDGGICRGTDVLKAIALGAKAVCVGRLQCWALAAGGEAGLVQSMEILEEEIIIAMGLIGVTRLDELGPKHLRQSTRSSPPTSSMPFPVVKEAIAPRPRGSPRSSRAEGAVIRGSFVPTPSRSARRRISTPVARSSSAMPRLKTKMR